MKTPKNTAPKDKRYWLSYDLGLRGDYDSLYEWLDEKNARECGDSVATFRSSKSSEELYDDLREILGEKSKARVYLFSSDSGKFIMGKRKAAPWAGYFQSAIENALDQ